GESDNEHIIGSLVDDSDDEDENGVKNKQSKEEKKKIELQRRKEAVELDIWAEWDPHDATASNIILSDGTVVVTEELQQPEEEEQEQEDKEEQYKQQDDDILEDTGGKRRNIGKGDESESEDQIKGKKEQEKKKKEKELEKKKKLAIEKRKMSNMIEIPFKRLKHIAFPAEIKPQLRGVPLFVQTLSQVHFSEQMKAQDKERIQQSSKTASISQQDINARNAAILNSFGALTLRKIIARITAEERIEKEQKEKQQ
ncbi:MAG: hypothetical protein EZS28_051120, partial [Streblomastix strix]